MSKEYLQYEDLSQGDLKQLHNQVQELEEMLSSVIDVLIEYVDDKTMSEKLVARWKDYKKSIN